MEKEFVRRFGVLVFLSLLMLQPSIRAEFGAFFTCDFLENYASTQWKIVDSRDFVAPLDSPFHFTMGNFSYRLRVGIVAEELVEIESAIICADRPPRNFFDHKFAHVGASLFFDSALVRNNSVYRIRLTVDSIVAHQFDCQYRYSSEDFDYDPSGDFDFHFIKHSLGDYRWNTIRDAFEKDYDDFIDLFDVNDRTKVDFYICPCPVADVGWDERWDNAFDFSRRNLFAHFTHGVNALHPQTVYMLKLMNLWGYAPAFLWEGTAGVLDYADHFARQAKASGILPDIAALGLTRKYRELDRELAFSTAGSFVGYLIKWRGRGVFEQYYLTATDLTLAESFEQVYGESFADAARQWHHYLDTVQLSAAGYDFYVSRAQTFMRYGDMLTWADALLEALGGDSVAVGPTLSSLHFTFGDYGSAAQFARVLHDSNSSNLNSLSYYANMLLAQGRVDRAEQIYQEVIARDSVRPMAIVKLGQIEFERGNYEDAAKLFGRALEHNVVDAFRTDTELLLGDALREVGLRDTSQFHYQRALDTAKLLVGGFSDNPLHHLRLAKAALRLGSTDLARQHLDLALFLEERMFYLGQIFLTYGQLEDVLNNRQSAIEEYRNVLDYPTAFLDRRLAERYLETPYRN